MTVPSGRKICGPISGTQQFGTLPSSVTMVLPVVDHKLLDGEKISPIAGVPAVMLHSPLLPQLLVSTVRIVPSGSSVHPSWPLPSALLFSSFGLLTKDRV